MQVSELLEKLDNNNKNQLENEIVNMGSSAVPAMSLIRIGEDSVSLLKEAANKNHDFTWVADYLINEIEGSKVA